MTKVTMAIAAPAVDEDYAARERDREEYADCAQASIDRARAERRQRWASYNLPAVTPLASFADYTAAAEKRRHLALDRTADAEELERANTAFARGMAARHDDETERQVQAVMAGRPDEAFEGFEELRAQITRLRQNVKVKAIAVGRQDEVIATIRSERSIDANETMIPAHRDAVAAIVAAITQLREAFDREEAVRSHVRDAGYENRLPQFGPSDGILRPGGEFGIIEHRAREYLR